ncbi:arylesterase domain-containing protein [Ceratobasidium sp. AG-Ba]|nr:arylesterase domain-containing protein [Ceratobasidium sp. AG-Ba]QRW03894.1 arylesterase domain-containing protein [Ceratobasidium sp. AG-Ba]
MFGKSSAVFFTFTAAALSASALSIDTPEKLTQCNTVKLNWHGKNAPFTLHVLPSCESGSDDPLLVLPPINATSYDWTVNIPSKTGAIAFAIVDFKGNEAYTDEIDIGKSDNTACFNAASSSSSAVPTSTGIVTTSAGVTPTTLIVSATATNTPPAPINVGSGVNPGSGSGSGGSGSSGTSGSSGAPSASGAIANTASLVVGAVGVAIGFFALL